MHPLEIKKKVKELEDLGFSQNKLAKFINVSPSGINRFLRGERSGLNLAVKILIFIMGTDRLSQFKVNGVTEKITAIKKHTSKGKIKIFDVYTPTKECTLNKSLKEKVFLEVENTLKTRKNIEEIPSKLKNLSIDLCKKYNNKIQIPYWIGTHLFKLLQSSDTSTKRNKEGTSLFCSTPHQESILFQGIKEIIKDLLIEINVNEKPWEEVDYRIRARDLEGFVLLYENNPEKASKSFLKAMQMGINWIGIQEHQEHIDENLSLSIWNRLLLTSLNNLNNALYSYKRRLVSDSKDFFVLLDKNFSRPGSVIGKAILEKVLEVMREHKENNLPSSPESISFNFFFKDYGGFKNYFEERLILEKECVLV